MKTISELNERWWYRLLKVIYIIFFSLFFISTVAIISDENSPEFNSKKSYVTCLDGRRFELRNYPYLDGVNLSVRDKFNFQDSCTTKGTDIKINSDFEQMKLKNEGIIPASQVKTPVSYFFHPYYSSRNWSNIILYSLLTFVITLTIAEAIRRSFYYIILGSIRPKKKYESNTILP